MLSPVSRHENRRKRVTDRQRTTCRHCSAMTNTHLPAKVLYKSFCGLDTKISSYSEILILARKIRIAVLDSYGPLALGATVFDYRKPQRNAKTL